MGKTHKKKHRNVSNTRHRRHRDRRMQTVAMILCSIMVVSSLVVICSQMFALGTGDDYSAAEQAALDDNTGNIDVQRNNSTVSASGANAAENSEIETEAEKTADEKLDEIIHSAKYPGQLKELAQKNEEAIDFIYDYPEEHTKEHEIDLTEEAQMETVPLLLQWDKRWGYEKYSGNYFAASGCGPTTLSMVVLYLTHNAEASPLAVAEYAKEAGYSVDGSGSAWALISEGCRHYGVRAKTTSIKEETMKSHLDAGNLIVVNVGPGDFTDNGHFMVITGYDDDGFIVNDPNSIIRSSQRWAFDTLASQIRSAWRMYI